MKKRLKALEQRVAALEARDHPGPNKEDADAGYARNAQRLMDDGAFAGLEEKHQPTIAPPASDVVAEVCGALAQIIDETVLFDANVVSAMETNATIDNWRQKLGEIRATLTANDQSVDDLPEDGGIAG